MRERGGGGGCSNERNLHDFACFSASWLRPSGFSFLPTFSACFSGCSHPATQERGGEEEGEERRRKGARRGCEPLQALVRGAGHEMGNYFPWFFSAKQWNIDGKKGGKESRGNLSRGGSFGVEGNYREKLALPSRTDDE